MPPYTVKIYIIVTDDIMWNGDIYSSMHAHMGDVANIPEMNLKDTYNAELPQFSHLIDGSLWFIHFMRSKTRRDYPGHFNESDVAFAALQVPLKLVGTFWTCIIYIKNNISENIFATNNTKHTYILDRLAYRPKTYHEFIKHHKTTSKWQTCHINI